jgi:hypothetical protein
MECLYKHTKYQPTNEEWACPKCNAPVGEFYVASGPDQDCLLLHTDDCLVCMKCDFSISGQAFANRVVKKQNLVPCPCCNGKGFVKQEKGE